MEWCRINRPGVEGENAVAMREPDVVLEVRAAPELGVIERFIYAVLRRRDTMPYVLMLDRGELVAGADVRDPVRLSKACLLQTWEAMRADGELEVLKEMWARPFMSAPELADLEAKYARIRAQGRERAAKLMEQRREELLGRRRRVGPLGPLGEA